MNDFLKNANGLPFMGKPGQFTRYNKDSERDMIPGISVYLKGDRLSRDRDQIPSPYTIETQLIERSGNLVFCRLGKSDYYTFPVKVDNEGREYFTTSRFHVTGVNDTQDMAYSDFIAQVHAAKEAVKAAAARAAEQRAADRINAEQAARKAAVMTKKSEVQKQIQALTPGMSADAIMKNPKIKDLLDEYVRCETLLKIRCL